MRKIAAIFDMDGTLIDNNPFHFRSWQVLFKRHNLPQLTQENYNQKMSGVPGLQSLRNLFGDDHDEAELHKWFEEKTAIYKEEYERHIKPINGLEQFLANLKDAGVPMAVASSAAPENVDFVFSHLTIGKFFDTIIDSTRLSQAKPNPQIFLKAAEELGIPPIDCVVFEDSVSGVKAANSAGMKVVAITTTHQPGELRPVNKVIKDYTEISVKELFALFEDKDE